MSIGSSVSSFQWPSSQAVPVFQPQQQRLVSGQGFQVQQVQPQSPYVLVSHPTASTPVVLVAPTGSQHIVTAAPPQVMTGIATPCPTESLTLPPPLPTTSTTATARRQVPVEVEVVSSGSTAPVSSPPPLQLGASPAKPPPAARTPVAGASYVPPHVPNRVPTAAGVEHLDPLTVYNLLRESRCILVDLRSDDRAAGLIDGSVHVPAIGAGSFLSRLPELTHDWSQQELVVLTCQYSAHRAPQCANWYRQHAAPSQRVAILSGGFRGWEATGLPVVPFSENEKEQASAAVDEIALKIGTQFLRSLSAQESPSKVVVAAPVMLQSPAKMISVLPATMVTTPKATATTTLGASPAGASAPGVMMSASPVVTDATTVQYVQQETLRPQPYGLVRDEATGKQVYVPPPCPNRVPTIAGIDHLDPTTVQNLMQENKCIVIDLRGEDRAAGLIDGALHVPAIDTVPFLTRVPDLVRQWADQKLVIFTCQYSAHRAPQCANWYRQQASPSQAVGILSGGFRGWESVGLPVKAYGSAHEGGQVADQKALQLGGQFVQSVPLQEAESQAAASRVLAPNVSSV